ncbi:MAG: alpha/beta hydrolase, partial [Gammaproteobacteria bacterium]|nr:alpha/beta hydrolase [Gammaproteobacteria bacterium]
ATYLASKRSIDRLALVTPFASLEDLARQHFVIFPVRSLLQDKYISAIRVPKISAATMILYAEDDTIIPYSSTRALIAAFPESQLEVKKIAGAGHNSISSFDEYGKWLREFFVKTD